MGHMVTATCSWHGDLRLTLHWYMDFLDRPLDLKIEVNELKEKSPTRWRRLILAGLMMEDFCWGLSDGYRVLCVTTTA